MISSMAVAFSSWKFLNLLVCCFVPLPFLFREKSGKEFVRDCNLYHILLYFRGIQGISVNAIYLFIFIVIVYRFFEFRYSQRNTVS